MSTDVNEDDAERRLARLREEWGEFPVQRESEAVPADQFDPFVADVRDGYTGGGYVWVVREPDQAAPLTESMPDAAADEEPRVMLVVHRGTDDWSAPGGGREDGEIYEEAAVREVREETSVEAELTGVARAFRYETTPDDDRDVTAHTLFVVFEGRYVDGHLEVQPGELNGAAWFRELPANLHPFAEAIAPEWEGGWVGADDRPTGAER